MTRFGSNSLVSLVPCVLALLGAGCAAGIEAEGEIDAPAQALSSCPPPVPAAIAVPAGNRHAFSFDAEGQQVYVCRANASGHGWVLKEPDADLLNVHSGSLAGHHYLGPTWEALDGSLVQAARVSGTTVDATAIPWLLLSATTHTGEGRMEHVSFIQRVDTVAGLAPSGGCDAAHLENVVDVDYTATYHFFVPSSSAVLAGQCAD